MKRSCPPLAPAPCCTLWQEKEEFLQECRGEGINIHVLGEREERQSTKGPGPACCGVRNFVLNIKGVPGVLHGVRSSGMQNGCGR